MLCHKINHLLFENCAHKICFNWRRKEKLEQELRQTEIKSIRFWTVPIFVFIKSKVDIDLFIEKQIKIPHFMKYRSTIYRKMTNVSGQFPVHFIRFHFRWFTVQHFTLYTSFIEYFHSFFCLFFVAYYNYVVVVDVLAFYAYFSVIQRSFMLDARHFTMIYLLFNGEKGTEQTINIQMVFRD